MFVAKMKDIQWTKGDEQAIEISIKKDGMPYDLSGVTVYFTVKKRLEDAYDQAVIRKIITEHKDAQGGVTEILIEREDTSELATGEYFYDIQVGGATVLKGKFVLLWEVTDV